MKKNFALIMAVAAMILLLSTSGSVFACTVEGDFNTPGTYPCAAGDLWTLLQDTGGGISQTSPPMDPTNHNWIEGDYVLVTGKHGSSALFSVGELDTKFAPAGTGATLTLDKKGGYDLAGEGRTVQDVCNIDVVKAVPIGKGVETVHPFSTLLIVSGEGITPRTYNLTDLDAMTQETFNASSSTTNTVGVWTGPTLLSVLEASGINTRDMNSFVVVSATDGYATVISMYEATHMTGAQYALLAIKASDGSINGTTSSDSGFARLILPNDTAAGRWVSNVDQIVVHRLPCKKACWFQR
jgi:hypothetical protein